MEVKDEIYEYIDTDLKKQSFVEAQEIADVFHIKRNVASHYLNRLVEEKRLVKDAATRPVRFRIPFKGESASLSDSVFSDFIGYDGSVKTEIDKCKSAVTYPGNGLPVILCGNSGTGKSFLASLLYKYAVQKGIIGETAPFVVLNCADYANNSELLSSILFGYVKGAFTGASEERSGLLDEADQGYLFLDEVHNLSAENQEKLFLFIDSQKFRRLGDSRRWIQAKVRLVFATTEDIHSRLLGTFRRRIPLEIHLPDFKERSYNERMQIVMDFFQQEAAFLHREIRVNGGLVENLVHSRSEGNIGQIKSDIKVACAQAYNQKMSGELVISQTKENSGDVYYRFSINKGQKKSSSDWNSMFSGLDFKKLEHLGFTALSEALYRFIKEFDTSVGKVFSSETDFLEVEKFRCLHQICSEEINPVLQLYGCRLTSFELWEVFKLLTAFLFASEAAECTVRLPAGEKRKYVKYNTLASRAITKILPHMNGQLRETVVSVLAAYFYRTLKLSVQLNALILMHGESSAGSIAHLANDIVKDYIYESFDMPMEVRTEELISQVNKYVEGIETKQGLIVLVDMGSLEQMYECIKSHVDGDLIIVNNVSTALAVDIASKLEGGADMAEIMNLSYSYFQVRARYYEGLSGKINIVVSCISGEGIAAQVKEILSGFISGDLAEVLTMDYGDLKAHLEQNDEGTFKNTLAVLTTSPLESEKAVVINIENIVDGSADLEVLSPVMTPEDLKNFTGEIVKLFTLKGAASRLSFLNPEKILAEVETVIDRYEMLCKKSLPNFLRVNMFLHISIMIERIMMKDVAGEDSIREREEEKQQTDEFIGYSKDIFKMLRQKYRIEIPRQEYLMIYQMLQPYL